jgi:enterochelin esterase-like enzyme
VGALDRVSLVGGPLPLLVTLLAFGLFATTVAGAWRRSIVVFVATLAVLVGIGRVVDIHALVDDGFPRSFYLWAALPLCAGVLTLVGWRRSPTWRRVVSAASVVALVAFAASTINAFYDYRPTVGDALGHTIGSRGRLVSVVIPGALSGFHARPALVWLPPAFTRDPRATWPVMMLMAGVPGDPTDMIRGGGAVRLADDYASHHHGEAPIMVFPDHNGGFFKDTECVDGPRGNAETYLVQDVRGFVASHFHASSDPGRWAIVGYSEGGTCAVTLTLRHPDDFGAFVDLAGDLQPNVAGASPHRPMTVRKLYGGQRQEWFAHDPLALVRERRARTVRAVFVAGSHDKRGTHHEWVLQRAAQRAGLVANYEQFHGGHNFGMVRRALAKWFPKVATRLLHP